MLYKVFETDDLLDMKETDRQVVELMENNGCHLKLAGLKKNQEIEPHMSHTNVTLYITDGELEITFPNDNNCSCQACGCEISEDDKNDRKYKLKKGQLFLFEKDVVHSIKALKDTTFLLIKI